MDVKQVVGEPFTTLSWLAGKESKALENPELKRSPIKDSPYLYFS